MLNEFIRFKVFCLGRQRDCCWKIWYWCEACMGCFLEENICPVHASISTLHVLLGSQLEVHFNVRAVTADSSEGIWRLISPKTRRLIERYSSISSLPTVCLLSFIQLHSSFEKTFKEWKKWIHFNKIKLVEHYFIININCPPRNSQPVLSIHSYLCKYVQSRERARAEHSQFIMMIEDRLRAAFERKELRESRVGLVLKNH